MNRRLPTIIDRKRKRSIEKDLIEVPEYPQLKIKIVKRVLNSIAYIFPL